ncbi:MULTISPECIES: tyrosine-type recombinase/integrase [Exiguobacterium]|uniref:tyrosine-type recombinase/integrase n=1 Tax=Exiguobacterium TaxID=33986 RepID=UPI001BE862B2|nr:tyrosine-type recombinase/integrase [Exiguobacterium himgiriensis]MCT4783353.1 tyrosine-type recombinase/integrase [Exiguobacterium himgiriensis]
MSLFRQLGRSPSQATSRRFDLNGYERMPDFIQRFFNHLAAKHYSRQTAQRYLYDFADFFRWVEAASLAEVDPRTVEAASFAEFDHAGAEAYAMYLALELDNAPSVINRKLSSMQSLFNFLIETGVTTTNPFQAVERPKRAKRNPVYLTESEWLDFSTFVRSNVGMSDREAAWYERNRDRDFLIIQLLGLSGIRVSELVGLDWSDIDLEAASIRVIGKGDKERNIPLAPPLVTLLSEWSELKTGPVFIGDEGKRLSVRTVQHLLKRHIDRLKSYLPFLVHKQVTPHKLRHTFASRLAMAGVDVLTIQQLLGHESVATTQVYAHIGDEKKKQAITSLQ